MEKPLHHFDKRIVRRSIKKGLLSEEEVGSHLQSLPDQFENIMPPEAEPSSEEAAPETPAPVDSSAGGA